MNFVKTVGTVSSGILQPIENIAATMTSGYERPFHDLNGEIRQFSPQSAVTLETLKAQCGTQAAYYAAFIVICLQAKAEQSGTESLIQTSSEDLQAFTFFEFCKDDRLALDLFDEVLEHYQNDLRQAR